MAFILPIEEPWTSQPQVAVGVDWSNPLANGIVGTVSGIGFDAVKNIPITTNQVTSTARGRLFLFNGSNLIQTQHPRVSGAFSVSFTILYKYAGVSRQSYVTQGGATSSGKGWSIGTPGGTTGIDLVFGGVAQYILSSSGLTDGKTHRVTVSISGNNGSAILYIDGVFKGSSAVGTVLTPSSKETAIGAGHNGTAYVDYAITGTGINDVIVRNKNINASLALEDYINPWQIFAP